mgnify:CR=1 FL=1
MSFCGDIWITPSTYERNIISFWRTRPDKYRTYDQARIAYWAFVQKQIDHAELLNSFNRQPVLTDYS